MLRKLTRLTAAAALLGAVALPLAAANATPYIGWDFGHGFGIGLGTPPSAITACPNYGFGPNNGILCPHPYPF